MRGLRIVLLAALVFSAGCFPGKQKRGTLGDPKNPCGSAGDAEVSADGPDGAESEGGYNDSDGLPPPPPSPETPATTIGLTAVADEQDSDDDEAVSRKRRRKRDAARVALRKRRAKSSQAKSRSAKRRGKRRIEVAELVRTAEVGRSDAKRARMVKPRLRRARAALRQADFDRAIRGAQQVLIIDGAHVGAVAVLAEAYYRKGWYRKAARMLATATTGSGAQAPRLWMLRGLVADAGNKPLEQVRAAYLRATKLAPRYAKAWNNLGIVYLRLQKSSKAIAAFETALANDKDSALVLTNLGTAYRRHAGAPMREAQRSELLRKAEQAYRAAIALDEDYAAAYLNLGVLYLDAPSFPKMGAAQRLTKAASYLREFKQRGVQARAEDGSPISVSSYIDAVKTHLEALVLIKRLDKKNKRRERRKASPAPAAP